MQSTEGLAIDYGSRRCRLGMLLILRLLFKCYHSKINYITVPVAAIGRSIKDEGKASAFRKAGAGED